MKIQAVPFRLIKNDKRLELTRVLLCASVFVSMTPLAHADEESITIGNKPLKVQVAVTRQEQTKGLQGYTHLNDNQGMLFVFNPARKVCFWMKGTPMNLDVGFFNEEGRLVQVEHMKANQLDLHCSRTPIRWAVEVNEGWFKRFTSGSETRLVRAPNS